MNNRLTVTIGIPAHNEEANIEHLLGSILSQQGDNFSLEKIVVVLDGCSDKTGDRVQAMQKENSIIELISDGKRLGKAGRLNQLYQMNKSDLLFTLDADVVLEGAGVINKLVTIFQEDDKAQVVAAYQKPLNPGPKFIAQVLYTNYVLWNEVTSRINNGDNINNLDGAATMLRGEFARSVVYPPNLTCDEGYLYVSAQQKNGFRFAREAAILHRPVSNLSEMRIGGSRILKERHVLVKYFGPEVLDLYQVPFKFKLFGIVRMFFRSPVYSFFAVIYNFWIKLFHIPDPLNEQGLWQTISSTKKAIIK